MMGGANNWGQQEKRENIDIGGNGVGVRVGVGAIICECRVM